MCFYPPDPILTMRVDITVFSPGSFCIKYCKIVNMTNTRGLNRVTLSSMDYCRHGIHRPSLSMRVQQTTKLIWSYKEVHHEWRANKEVLSRDRVQSFSNSKHLQAKRYTKAHYINTVVCSQTHHYILETCLSSCCIDTKPFKNCMVQRKLLEFQSVFALTDHTSLVKLNLNSNSH